MNNKSFQYLSHCGTVFECAKCDFSAPIYVEVGGGAYDFVDILIKDVAEMIGYHAVNIRPELNGFAGYDCLTFKDKSLA